MSAEPSAAIHQNDAKKFEVQLVDGGKIICDSQADAELVLDAVRRFYEGNTGRKLPRETLAALETAGLNATNSLLYRSAMHHVAAE